MIKTQVIGHLGRDAVKNDVHGKTVINFSVAHSEKFKDAQGVQKEKSLWVDCAYWTDKTGILPYLVKGAHVYVEGVPDVRTWEKDGKTNATITLRVGQVQLLGSAKHDGQSQHQPVQQSSASNSQSDEAVDDLPF